MALPVTEDGQIQGHDQTETNFAPKVGSPAYIAKIKVLMAREVGPDQPGEDSNNDGMYAGKSLDLGEGGRAKMLTDRITLQLVEDGMSYDDAKAIARNRMYLAGVEKYGAKQMTTWAKG